MYFLDIMDTEEKVKVNSAPEEPLVPRIDIEKQKKMILKRALQTECDSETVTVAINKVVLEVSWFENFTSSHVQ